MILAVKSHLKAMSCRGHQFLNIHSPIRHGIQSHTTTAENGVVSIQMDAFKKSRWYRKATVHSFDAEHLVMA
jgi:hypothetical protein